MSSDRRRDGCCALCDAQVFESITTRTEGHPLAGDIALRGKPKSDAIRVMLVLMDGSVNYQSVCEKCLPYLSNGMAKLWKKNMKRQVMGIGAEYRQQMGMSPLNDQQRESVEVEALRMLNNRPIGVIAVQRWREVIKR